jgi:diguanylate cyclase (GGDEF)-like protein
MTNIVRGSSKSMQGLGSKMLVALAAAALPALAVATILGMTLVREVGEAETDFNHASSAALELREMLVLIEREHGLIARLPAELDLGRIEAYARQIAALEQEFESEMVELANIEGIVVPEVVSEIRATRQQMKGTAEAIVQATKSFAQATALDLVDGPFEESTKVLRTLLEAIGSNVDSVVEHARSKLRASSRQAWILTPIALIGALCASVFGIWMVRRDFVLPVAHLTDRVLRIRKSGNLDVPLDSRILGRDDEIGTLSRSFNLMISDLGNASQRLIASEAETRMQYERLNAAINNMPQGLCMFDAGQRLIICNKRYAEIYGMMPEHTVPGTPLRIILEHRVANGTSPDNDQDYVENRVAAASERKPLYLVNELGDGHVIAVSHQPMLDGGCVATHEDITERRKVEAQIAYMAHHDALTDLPNRVSFREEMAKALHRVERGETLAVLCIDLDHFKTVNDTLGHPVGDALLQAASERLRACVRPNDTVARLGGDEFAIVQVGSEQPAGSTTLAMRLVNEISRPFDVLGHQVVIGTSVGIAIAPNDGNDPDHLLKGADLALYRAKEDGRGTFRFFEPDMDTRMHARRALAICAERSRSGNSNFSTSRLSIWSAMKSAASKPCCDGDIRNADWFRRPSLSRLRKK